MLWGWGFHMGWWMLVGGILFVIFWGAIITLIFWIVRRSVCRPHLWVDGEHSPLDTAKERYARGEINKEQFEQIKKDLTG